MSRREVLRELSLIGLALLLYFGIRNATAGGAAAARANGEWIVRVEDQFSLAWESFAQRLIRDSDTFVMLANWVYIWGHWPVILACGVALFLTARERYRLLRNAMFISGAIGFLLFAFFPVAPPRLLDLGLLDTVTNESSSYRALQPPGLTNQFAAFPSLHAGWNVLLGIVLFGTSTRLVVRVFAVASPIAMSFAVVATANHFVLDVAVGVAVVVVGFAIARLTPRAAATVPRDEVDRGASIPPAPIRRRAPRRQPAGSTPRRGGAVGSARRS